MQSYKLDCLPPTSSSQPKTLTSVSGKGCTTPLSLSLAPFSGFSLLMFGRGEGAVAGPLDLGFGIQEVRLWTAGSLDF